MKIKYIFPTLFLLILFTGETFAQAPSCLSITGVVRQPLNLTIEDLKRGQTLSVQLHEVTKAGLYRGSFEYQGTPLKNLLELASVEKEETQFAKKVDLAILVRNRQGKQIALSWGEVFYRNPGEIIVATSAVAIKTRRRPGQSQTETGFPKLVVSGDRYADRTLENITSIEVLDLRPKMPATKLNSLFSAEFSIEGAVSKKLTCRNLSPYPRRSAELKRLEDTNVSVIIRARGTCLKDILSRDESKFDLCTVFLVSAPSGYRALFSYGEIFLSATGEGTLIADTIDGQPIIKGGKFTLFQPGDLFSGRHVASINKIEVLSIQQKPKLYVIGIGSGDTNLISMEAVSYMAKADLFVCPEDIKNLFTKYMGNKQFLFDLYEFAPPPSKKAKP